jgi:hypothetical protein
MAYAKPHLVKKQIDVLVIVADDPEDIAKGVEMSGEKSEVKAQIGIVRECKCPVRGQVQAGPSVLDGLIIIKTQTKGGDSLTERR